MFNKTLILALGIVLLGSGDLLASRKHHNNDGPPRIGRHVSALAQKNPKEILDQLPANFNAQAYTEMYPEVVSEAPNHGMTPLDFAIRHYVTRSKDEERLYLTGPFVTPANFNAQAYLDMYPHFLDEARRFHMQPLIYARVQFIIWGQHEVGRLYLTSPFITPDNFNAQAYLDMYPHFLDEARRFHMQPLIYARVQYIKWGQSEGRLFLTCPYIAPAGFTAEAYYALHPEIRTSAATYKMREELFALAHYLSCGVRQGRTYLSEPRNFVPSLYLSLNPDVLALTARMSHGESIRFAQEHYYQIGRAQNLPITQEEKNRRDLQQQEERIRLHGSNQALAEMYADRNAKLIQRIVEDLEPGEDPAPLPDDKWIELLPTDRAAFPRISRKVKSPMDCCTKFLRKLPNRVPDSFGSLLREVQGRMGEARVQAEGARALAGEARVRAGEARAKAKAARAHGRETRAREEDTRAREEDNRASAEDTKSQSLLAVKSFWEKISNNIIHAQGNWAALGIEFLNEAMATLNHAYMQRYFGHLWSKRLGDEQFASMFELFHNFSRMGEEQQAYVIMEWKYHILPSIRKTCEWIQQIHDLGLAAIMNAALVDCESNNPIVGYRIQAFRLPVVEAPSYMFKYLRMLLDYKPAPGELSDSCLIALNLRPSYARFGSIQITIPGAETNSYLHPEYTVQSFQEVFNPVHFVEANQHFARTFIECYTKFKNAGLISYFRDKLIIAGNACCLNARAGKLIDGHLNELPRLLGAENVVNAERARELIVSDFLRKLHDANEGVDGITISHENLHNLLIAYFRVGQKDAVRGANGEITEKILKLEIKAFAEHLGLEFSDLNPKVYEWAKSA